MSEDEPVDIESLREVLVKVKNAKTYHDLNYPEDLVQKFYKLFHRYHLSP